MEHQIFNIQKFSIHDGPGIRTTVFFKGCPLNCIWCHNPESINAAREIMWDNQKCSHCGTCAAQCPAKSIAIEADRIKTDLNSCTGCETCTEYCLSSARAVVGKTYDYDTLYEALTADRIFYETSDGGVTFSGGEPLIHADYLIDLLKRLKAANIHITVDTSGYVPYEQFEKILPYVDLFMYDIKFGDSKKHHHYTGVYNDIIKENLYKLSQQPVTIWGRIPLIKPLNTTDEELNKILYILNQSAVKDVFLLPYHHISGHKYRKLGMPYLGESLETPDQAMLTAIQQKFIQSGYHTHIGG
ncbi:glycyl-radical enzyme activating protein [Fusibacter paucivorans]|uniref:Glycyl-radical enzyme activating protein n=1 Tax=Fusibacter paucivorans TaxID=76009 RepID=A0ABS5PTZ0_9FIRM|nr:glycyl-radical enzyme activating protein [Fusibacter paucivorans]MBS7527492.1 glycyl-radical enzyme activating protein [Fusibacter paucivorans]